uniref:(northern house mosquito) hypothetical protein n=1 Tax=Culex pipiens TaxID=7175 RepID=A0A8D8DS76_CULPI
MLVMSPLITATPSCAASSNCISISCLARLFPRRSGSTAMKYTWNACSTPNRLQTFPCSAMCAKKRKISPNFSVSAPSACSRSLAASSAAIIPAPVSPTIRSPSSASVT